MSFPKFLEDLAPEIYLKDHYATLDFETTNIDKGSAIPSGNRVVLWSGLDSQRDGIHGQTFTGNSDDYSELLDFVQRPCFVIAHNAKFELQWLYRLGLKPGAILVWDTMIAQYVINGNRRTPLDLSSVAASYGLGTKLNLVSHLIKEGVCPSLIPEKRLREYCEQDVRLTHELFKRQLEVVRAKGLLPVVYTRCLTTNVLADIEMKGMNVDATEVFKEYEKEKAAYEESLAGVLEITGDINPNSHKQVGEHLYDSLKFEELTDGRGNPIRTPSGRRKTDEDTILGLNAITGAQKAFVNAIRSYIPSKKRMETLEKLHQISLMGDLLYANFNQCVTRTHRLSSSGRNVKVQFQNIDRDFKRLFRPRHKGWKNGEADAPQLEFRTAADLGGDTQAKKDIRDKVDVHKVTASVLLKKAQELITKNERTLAKPRTFAPLYGANSGTKAEKDYNKFFRKKYWELNQTQTSWTYDVLKDKQLRLASGLVMYWPDCRMDERTGYIQHTTEIYNYPVQSFATAEIIPISLVYTWYRMQELRSFIVNTVHDSIVAEIHPEEQDAWISIIKQAFTEDVFTYLDKIYGYKFSTPLGVGWQIGDHWGDGKEYLFELDPELS